MRAIDTAPSPSDEHQETRRGDPREVQKALTAILQSPPFRSTKQMQKLLQFIVLETLAGRSDLLKERNIGAHLFDKRPDYDTNSDPTVRLRVAELRKRLALYYQGARDETVLINIPSGSFRAVFEWSGKHSLPVSAGPIRKPDPLPPSLESIAPPAGSGIVEPAAKPLRAKFGWSRWWARSFCLAK